MEVHKAAARVRRPGRELLTYRHRPVSLARPPEMKTKTFFNYRGKWAVRLGYGALGIKITSQVQM